MTGGAGGLNAGQEGQAHSGRGTPPGLVEVAQEGGLGNDEEVVAGAARGQEDGGAVGAFGGSMKLALVVVLWLQLVSFIGGNIYFNRTM